jgi:signal transduction histidine kinase/CheY-like chemotaxis protein/type II secretory pathway pseudopilin PulG
MALNITIVAMRRVMFVMSVIVAIAILYAILRFQFYPAFERIERIQAEQQTLRAARLLQQRATILETLNREYSDWEITYDYMQGNFPDYFKEYLTDEYLDSADLQFAAMLDLSGNAKWSWLRSTDGEELALEQELLEPLSNAHPLARAGARNTTVKGLWRLRSGLLLVVAQPIRLSDGSGQPVGSFVTGYYVTNTVLEEYESQANLSLELFDFAWTDETRALAANDRIIRFDLKRNIEPPGNWDTFLASTEGADFMSTAMRRRLAEQGPNGPIYTAPVFSHDWYTLRHHLVFNDLFSQATALLQVDTQREVSHIGLHTMRLSLVVMCVAALLIGYTFHLILMRWVFNPLISVKTRMENMLNSGNLQKLNLKQRDEIGAMARTFDRLVDQLKATQEDLAQKRNEALAASRAKSDFLATMSHEIRTPMNGVLGMAELLVTTPLDDRQARFVATIRNSGELLLSVINDILDFSKIESGKLSLDIHPFNLRALTDDIMDFFATQAHQKKLELLLDFPPDLDASYLGDSNRVRQVLVNLLGNALKFTEQGEILLKVSPIEAFDPANEGPTQTLLFEITDTGIGIARDKQEIIFDDFSQADSSSARQYGGTGLGLAITRHLVKLMGGEIKVSSQPGKGSRFYFSIPLDKGEKASPGNCEPPALEGMRVLVVDDNATNREILSLQLEAWKMQGDTADNGIRALKMLKDAASSGQPYQLVLMDWHMPLLTGPDVAQRAADDPDIPATPTIILSSAYDTANVEDLACIDKCLPKPVRQSCLLDSIVELMAGRIEVKPTPTCVANSEQLNLSVLLAEDNVVNQHVATHMLRRLGCDVEIAANGHEALDLVEHHHFDIVLMDCDMPGMNGFDATTALRNNPRPELAQIAIIALTAHASLEIRQQCMDVGMNDYLQKPYKLDELEDILKKWMHNQPEEVHSA